MIIQLHLCFLVVYPPSASERVSRPPIEREDVPVTQPPPSWNYKEPAPVFQPNILNRDPDLNFGNEAQSRDDTKLNQPPITEQSTTLPIQTARTYQETTPFNPRFDGNVAEKEQGVYDSDENPYSEFSEDWQDGDQSFENVDHINEVASKETPRQDLGNENAAKQPVDWPIYQDSYASELENSKQYRQSADYDLAEKNLDSNARSYRDFEPFFPGESASDTMRANYAPMTPNPIQHDAQDTYLDVEPPISRQHQNYTESSESNGLNPGGLKVAGSLSVVTIIVLIAIASVVVLAIVAGIVWFVCIRGH